MMAAAAPVLWFLAFMSCAGTADADGDTVCHYALLQDTPFETLAQCAIEGPDLRPSPPDPGSVTIGMCLHGDDPLYLRLLEGLGEPA